MSSTSVEVTNIAPSTSKKSLEDFFSFCGTVTNLELSPDTDGKQKATVTFAKDSAASTAAMLHGGSLDGAPLTVKAPHALLGTPGSTGSSASTTAAAGTTHQEDKPRTAIVAEILAHGYHLSDEVTRRAVDLDTKHGISTRFSDYLTKIDRHLGERLVKGTSQEPLTAKTEGTPSGPAAADSASEKNPSSAPVPGTGPGNQDKLTTTVPAPDAKSEAAATDGTSQQPSLIRHVQGQVQSTLNRPDVKEKTDFAWNKLSSFYNTVASHPKVQEFYTNFNTQAQSVNEEAKRLAAEKKAGSGAATPTA